MGNALDASIILGAKPLQLENPLAQYAQMLQARGLQQQNALADVRMQQAQGEMADQAGVRNALSGLPVGAGADERIAALYRTGSPAGLKMAGEMTKQGVDTAKTQAQTEHAQAQTKGAVFDNKKKMLEHGILTLQTAQTPQEALAQIDDAVAQGWIKPDEAAQGKAKIPTDQGQFEQWRPNQLRAVTDAYRQLQSPDNIANNARQVSEGALNRAQTERSSARSDARMRDSTGAAGAVGTGKPEKPLSNPVVKQLTEARDNAATIDRLNKSFKDDFAGKGLMGMGADTQLGASATLGVDKGAVDWWKNYRKQAELVERHSLFGAALTPTEQASWRSADISPGMASAVIKTNLATRAALTKRMFENTQQDLIDAGHSPGRINAIAGRNAEQSGGPAPIKSDADYAALPSGAEFIAPDGSHRRKP